MWSRMGQKNLPALSTNSTNSKSTDWLKFHHLRAVMTSTPYIAFTFLEQLFALINNHNEDTRI